MIMLDVCCNTAQPLLFSAVQVPSSITVEHVAFVDGKADAHPAKELEETPVRHLATG